MNKRFCIYAIALLTVCTTCAEDLTQLYEKACFLETANTILRQNNP